MNIRWNSQKTRGLLWLVGTAVTVDVAVALIALPPVVLEDKKAKSDLDFAHHKLEYAKGLKDNTLIEKEAARIQHLSQQKDSLDKAVEDKYPYTVKAALFVVRPVINAHREIQNGR